jgi:hypothetical protein
MVQDDQYGLVEGKHELRYWDAADDVAPVKLPYNLGTCLLYRLDVHHRALPVAEGQTQISMHLTIVRKAVTWVGAAARTAAATTATAAPGSMSKY